MRAAVVAVLLSLSGCAEFEKSIAWLDSKIAGQAQKVDRVSALEARVSALEEKEWIISDEMVEALRDERDTFRDVDSGRSGDHRPRRVDEKTFVNYFR